MTTTGMGVITYDLYPRWPNLQVHEEQGARGHHLVAKIGSKTVKEIKTKKETKSGRKEIFSVFVW